VGARDLNITAPAPGPGPATALGLYVHVPFCATKCPYCDFNTYARIEDLIPDYVGALGNEIATWGAALGRPSLATVFYGGGTPSYLPPDQFMRLAHCVEAAFRVMPGAEITVEANPDDCSPAKLASLLDAGANRISIGVQSLDDTLLRRLGRRHDSKQALGAVREARAAGFDNLSVDLMFGLPHQSQATWESTVHQVLESAPDHVSMYALTIEPATPFAALVQAQELPEPDPDRAADMYEFACEAMESAGFRHYEISNWAKPGRASRHNLIYWRNSYYLGVGPGAHSFLPGVRFADLKSPREYVRRAGSLTPELANGVSWVEAAPDVVRALEAAGVIGSSERISRSLEMAETMMMGLRLDQGVGNAQFQARFGQNLAETYPSEIADLTRLGLLEQDAEGLRLTTRGRLLGNEAFGRFVMTAQPA